MPTPNAKQRFAAMTDRWSIEEYNFDHFGLKEILFDVKQIATSGGLQPGALAPAWELPKVGGGRVRLNKLRDRPVLLHFGSFT